MIPELVATVLMTSRWLFDDPFVKLAKAQLVLFDYGEALQINVAMWRWFYIRVLLSIFAGIAVPVIALLVAPPPYTVPLASASAFAVYCDWLMTFSGGRVRTSWAPALAGLKIELATPIRIYGISAERIVRSMCLAVAAMFFGIAFLV